jgi:hypothetical protein
MRKKRLAVSLAGGLGIGFVCFGLAVALVFFVIRPSIERGTHGLNAYHKGDIRVWYANRKRGVTGLEPVRAQTEALLYEVAESIHVDPEELPLPIELFLHQDLEELINSVVHRDSDYRSVNWAVLDQLPWEDPRVRVSELLLTFGWGKCTCQILYAGMALYAAYPGRNFHSFIAALPVRARHSVGELISLEASGSFPQTFYQAYASPFVMRFGLSLSAAKRHFDIPKYFSFIPERHQLYLEAASLVQYLIEEHNSMDAVRAAWGVGFSENILKKLTGFTHDELTLSWHGAALREGLKAADYPLLHTQLLIELGECEAAFEITESWSVADATVEQIQLMILSALFAGESDRAQSLIDQPAAALIDPDVLHWSRHLAEGGAVTTGAVRIVGASSAIASGPELRRIQATADAIAETLGMSDSDLAELVTVVVHTDPEQREWARKTISTFGLSSALTQVTQGEDVPLAMARALLPYALGETRSKLLERGLALMVSRDRSQLIAQADQLRSEGKWQPFGTLSYMGQDETEVDVQAASLVQTILDEFGGAKLREIWRSTSTLAEGYCLDTALRIHVGITRQELEDRFLAAQPGSP